MLNGVVESCPEADAIQMFCTRQWNKSIVNRFPGTYIAKFSQAHVIANMLIGAYIYSLSQTLSIAKHCRFSSTTLGTLLFA